MANNRSGLFDFLFRQADGDTHLERWRNNLLRLKVIIQRLETANKDTIRKALAESQFSLNSHDNVEALRSEIAYLVNHILQQILLVFRSKSLRGHHLGFQNKDHDGILRSAGTIHPITARIQLCPHSFGVLPELRY